jgi:hypothetical protein
MKKEEGRMKKQNGLRDCLPLAPLLCRGAREAEIFVVSLACKDALPSGVDMHAQF